MYVKSLISSWPSDPCSRTQKNLTGFWVSECPSLNSLPLCNFNDSSSQWRLEVRQRGGGLRSKKVKGLLCDSGGAEKFCRRGGGEYCLFIVRSKFKGGPRPLGPNGPGAIASSVWSDSQASLNFLVLQTFFVHGTRSRNEFRVMWWHFFWSLSPKNPEWYSFLLFFSSLRKFSTLSSFFRLLEDLIGN